MSRSLHVRPDDNSAAALRIVREGSSIAAEVERLAADEGDRSEVRIVRDQLAELAPEHDAGSADLHERPPSDLPTNDLA